MSMSTEKPAFIGVDWGTSSFRAWLFGPSGEVLESTHGLGDFTDSRGLVQANPAGGCWKLAG